MAKENPDLGYTRIRGALHNLGHDIGRNTIKRILIEAGMDPASEHTTAYTAELIWRNSRCPEVLAEPPCPLCNRILRACFVLLVTPSTTPLSWCFGR